MNPFVTDVFTKWELSAKIIPVQFAKYSIKLLQTPCKQMIIMPEFQPFSSIKKEVIPDKTYGDIFYVN